MNTPPEPDLLATLYAAAALPDGLFDAAAVERVRAVAAALPAALTSWVYLECRLLGELDRVDFIVRVDALGRERLAASCPALARFARQWDQGAGWPVAPEALWLEYDLPPSATSGPPVPRVFFDHVNAGAALLRSWAKVVPPAATLIGARPPVELEERLVACCEAAPAGASLPYIGLADLAAWRSLRLCIAGLSGDGLARVLHATGWPGDIAVIARQHAGLIARLAPAQDRVGLVHVDLVPTGVASLRRVGLEYGVARFGDGRLVDALVERGLCHRGRRVELEAWPARAVRVLPHQLWQSHIVRKINHVKIVHDEQGVVEVKAYLSLSHRFNKIRDRVRAPRVAPELHRARRIRGVGSVSWRSAPCSGDPPKGRDAVHKNREQAMTAVLARSAVDRQFRHQLLIDPRAALQAAFALVLPRDYNIQFVERAAHLDAMVVLPDFKGAGEDEIDDRALEAVNGGTAGDGAWAQEDGAWSDGDGT